MAFLLPGCESLAKAHQPSCSKFLVPAIVTLKNEIIHAQINIGCDFLQNIFLWRL
jgi:hypothetical protein